MSDTKTLIGKYGLSEVARRVDESPQTVNGWRRRNAVPPEKCQVVVDAFPSEVTHAELCPKVFAALKKIKTKPKTVAA